MKKFIFNLILIFTCTTSFSQTLGGTIVKGTKKIERVETTLDTVAINAETGNDARSTTIAGQPTGDSNEVGITDGQLSVSLTGAATYSIPISVPPGINGIVPQISLTYNSQAGNGIAGFGWNISGLSSIKKVPITKYHEGIGSGISYAFALDGQRLIRTSANNVSPSIYVTENFSNLKISFGADNSNTFLIEYPDGSIANYSTVSSSEWAITYWQNSQGVRINYFYTLSNNVLYISSITYGSTYESTGINTINFIYDANPCLRPEQAYVFGVSQIRNKILKQIYITGVGTVGYKNYNLEYDTSPNTLNSLKYQRLTKITEKSGDNLVALNPTLFSYNNTSEIIIYSNTTTTLPSFNGVEIRNSATVAGDFDGDGKMDVVLYPIFGADTNKWFSVLTKMDGSSPNIGATIPTLPSAFVNIFATNFKTYTNKLSSINGITTIRQVGAVNNYEFRNYYYEAGAVYTQNVITIQLPGTDGYTFYDGDFNGDGLTDVLAKSNNSSSSFYINLDMSATTNPLALSGGFNPSNISFISKTGDYNGDGKTDLFIFEEGNVSVYTVSLYPNNPSNNSLNGLGYLYDSDITLVSNKTILLGDFNGDGKTDFLVSPPSGSGISNWIKYTATVNSYPSFFARTIENYPSLLYGNPNENYSYNTLFATDFDNDGKTDLLKLTGYKNTSQSYGNVTVRCYPNKNGGFSGLTGGFYTATSGNQTEITKWALPIFYNSNQINRKLEIGFILGNKIHYFLSSKDFNKDKLLRTITTGNGVKETITYKPLIEESVNNASSPNVYFPEGNYIEDYPNTDIRQSATFQVVSKLERESKDTDSYRKQFYTYYGAVANLEGLGFLGFRATMRTNWHTGVAPYYLISTVSRNDIGLRGANIQNFTTGVYQNANSTLSSFASYISKEDITYNDYDIVQARLQALQPNKVFKLKVIESEKYDGLNKTSQETLATGFDIYNNPAQVTINTKKLAVIEKTSVIDLTYDNQVVSGTYIVGRPLSKAVTSTIYPTLADQDIFKENEWYTYTDNLLSKIRRRGNANPKSMYEINHYDIFGNLTQKIITDDSTLNKPSQSVASKDVSNPIGTEVPVGPPAPRVLDYEYNPAAPYYGRFLTKSYNVEHLPTTYDYNCSVGTLSSITNPYGFTTSFLYDKWFKQTQVTDYLGKSKFTTYTRDVEKSKITTTSSSGGDATTEVLYDDLFRNIRTGIVNLNGTWTYQSNLYNLHDRVYKTSEPYSTTPSLWNETKYDPYGRVSQTIDATLKTTSISYGNLTMTVDDTQKQTVLVKNSMGNLISSSDTPGGTITNKYFANGNLKSSTYDNGGTTVFEQDQWGRRKKMTDPSAGVFSYLYNIYGETVKETNPNGTIDYTLDNFGNIIKKVVIGNNGDYTKTNYTFDDTTRLLTSSSFEDVTAGSTTNYVYGYDGFKRLTSIDESSPLAHFYNEVQFDGFGRPFNIRYTATNPNNTGQTSDKWINYTYQNGYKYQIKDGFNGVGTTLWQTNTVNDRGQILTAQLGNGIILTNTINSYGDPTKIKHDKTVTNIMTLNTTFNAAKSRLLTRDSNVFGTGASLWSEDFTSRYDNNDRLTGYKAAEGTSYVTQSYDTNGNINTNNIGTYEYNVTTGKPFQTAAITPASPAMLTYYADREQTILYNTIKKPIRITGNNQEIIDFDYNFAESRSTMYYGNSDTNKLARPFIKSYSADGSMEIRRNTTNGTIEFITYIDGDAYTAPVLLKTDGTISTLQNYLYLHRDYQGSIVAITDGTGAVKEKRLFDAWGSLIKYWNSTGLATVPTTEGVMLIDRGYTGHEHLLGVGLINMNGRLYDPRLHRFLSPDNNLQDPLNTQNYNRYVYVLNNPLNYTDTSGEDCDECPNNGWTFTYEQGNPYENYHSDDGRNFGNWVKQNNNSFSNWFNNNVNSLGENISDFVDWLTGAESPPSVPSTVYQQNAPSQLGVFDTRSNSLQSSYNTGDIHMPTQHHFMGVNMTELSEGNIIEQALYSTANSVNLVAQYMMGRSVGDSSMRNLNGTPTRTNEAALSIGTLPLLISGGGAVESGLATTSNGFLFGSIGFKTPINLKVGLYASEKTLKYGTFKWSTIAPKVLAKFNFFGRKFLQITSEFQPTLGNWSTQTIEKGTKIRVGLVGPQGGNGFWTWIQFYADDGVKYIKP